MPPRSLITLILASQMLVAPEAGRTILVRGEIYTVGGGGAYYHVRMRRVVVLNLRNDTTWEYAPMRPVERPVTYDVIKRWAKRQLKCRH